MPYHSFKAYYRRASALRVLPLSCLFLVAACGDDAGIVSDAGPDAAPLQCSERSPLTIGQCVDTATGSPCLDFLAPTRSWLSITDQPVVPPIIGLQGSPMFVLSASGAGIERGMDSTAPYVEVYVTQGEDDVGGYASRPLMIDDPDINGNDLAPQLYVVAFLAEGMTGQTVQVRAQARDLNDELWCTEGSFEVGTLITPP